MNRRGFLGALFGGAATAAANVSLDPEKLLWVPGAKTIFIPPAPTIIKSEVVLAHFDYETFIERDSLFAWARERGTDMLIPVTAVPRGARLGIPKIMLDMATMIEAPSDPSGGWDAWNGPPKSKSSKIYL